MVKKVLFSRMQETGFSQPTKTCSHPIMLRLPKYLDLSAYVFKAFLPRHSKAIIKGCKHK